MLEKIKTFIYYSPVQISFFTITGFFIWALWTITGSISLTVLGAVLVGQPLALLVSIVIAFSYPEEESDF